MLNHTLSTEAQGPGGGSGMLGKLLKYEFRATARLYLPLYLVVLAFGVLGRFSFRFPWVVISGENEYGHYAGINLDMSGFWGELVSILMTFIIVGYVLVVLGALVVHFIITLQRFWKNLMGDEGYLMFTLPVSVDALLWSKAICAFVWGIVTWVVILLSVVIICGQPTFINIIRALLGKNLSPSSAIRIHNFLSAAFPFSFWVKLVLAFVLDGFANLFVLYAAMAIGHTVRNHKVLASVGGYMAISMVVGTASGILGSALAPYLARSLGSGLPEDFFATTPEDMLVFGRAFGEMMSGTMVMGLIITVVILVVGFLLARYLLRTQLNLE